MESDHETRNETNTDYHYNIMNSSSQDIRDVIEDGENKQVSNVVSQTVSNSEDHSPHAQFKPRNTSRTVSGDVVFNAQPSLEKVGKKNAAANLDTKCTFDLETVQSPNDIPGKVKISNYEIPSVDWTTSVSKISSIKTEEEKDFECKIMSALVSFLSEDAKQKKSIFANRGYHGMLKKASSKATIQWEDGIEKKEEQPVKRTRTSSSPLSQLGLLVTRGVRWKNIHAIVRALRMSGEGKLVRQDSADKQFAEQEREMIYLVRELGTDNLNKRQYVELSLEQKRKLKEMIEQVKLKNDAYLSHHPELGVLLSLVYKQLFKHLPDNPVVFVANYIHYLNTHREELILEPDVDVPFDRVHTAEEMIQLTPRPSQHKEQVTQFARKLVLSCTQIASRGIPYLNVKSIVDSMLRTVCPSEDDIVCLERSIERASDIVTDILMSSVAEEGTQSVEMFVATIVEAIMENVCPAVERNSEEYLEVCESVEEFVKNFVESTVDETIMLREGSSRNEESDL